MYYVEVLFARRMFVWFASIVVLLGVVVAFGVGSVAEHIHIKGPDAHQVHVVPFGALFSIAGYATCIMTTMVAATLNRDRDHLPYMWTRPMPRERIALSYMVVDIATIVAAFCVVTFVAAFVTSVTPHLRLGPDPEALTKLVRFIALPLMWYGLVEVATSWNTLKGSAAAGVSWAVFWILIMAAVIPFPAPVAAIVAVLNIFNPLAYFVSTKGDSVVVDPVTLSTMTNRHLIPAAYSTETLMAYGIFLGSLIVATYVWRRMEA